jgi:HPt (histidine-containing phosphotransfer) domain-containing protein
VAPVFDQPQATVAVEQLPLIDQRAMADWRGELDQADVMDLLARVPGECDKCLTGIKEATAKGDIAGVKRMAHRLKGMASNLGAARLAGMARGIEIASTDLADVTVRTVALEETMVATLDAILPEA